MQRLTWTILAGCAAAALSAGAAQALTLTVQSSFNANDYTMRFFDNTWLPKLAKETDGRVKMKLLPNGSVVPGNQTLDATAMGVIDGDFTS
ncbi:C4-dicarboxylate ABC transporter substrate-binding protein, partial [Thioclava sp. BHET1]